MVTHGGFDNSDINKDVNAMFPIDRLHELVQKDSSAPCRKKHIPLWVAAATSKNSATKRARKSPRSSKPRRRRRPLYGRLRDLPPFGNHRHPLL